VSEPSDPLDAEWRALLERSYPPPFAPATADFA
jgi:hypothetical protein